MKGPPTTVVGFEDGEGRMLRGIHRVFIPAVATLVVAPALVAGPQESPAPQFPAETSVVNVDVVVLDDDGNAVRDLTSVDFVVEEDGEPQEISSFRAVEVPVAPVEPEDEFPSVSTNVVGTAEVGRTFAVVLDATHLTPEGAFRAREAVAEFLSDGLRPGDSVSLVSTGGGIWWTATGPRGRDKLLRLLDEVEGGRVDSLPPKVYITDWEAVRIMEHDDRVVAGAVYRRLIQAGVTYDPAERAAAEAMASMPAELIGAGNTSGERGGTIEAWLRFHPEVYQYASQLYDVVRKRRRAALETLERVLESLTTKGGRKSVLLVSEGFVADDETPRFREVMEAARRANAAIYFFDARGLIVGGQNLMTDPGMQMSQDEFETAFLGLVRQDLRMNAEGSETLAAETGGFTVRNTNDLHSGFERVAREQAVYYLLGYRPANEARDGKYRKIEVKVDLDDVTVRARKGYYAPRSEEQERARQEEETDEVDVASPLLQRAIDAPFELESIPLRVSTYAFDAVNDHQANVLVATEVDIRNLAFEREDGRYRDRLSVVMVVLDLESGTRHPLNETLDLRLTEDRHRTYEQTWYPIHREFQLPTGTYQVRVVVLDDNSRRLGSVSHEFEVPELGGWRVSSPVLSDHLDDQAEGGMPQPLPLARRTFAPEGRLYCFFSVYGSDDVAGGFSLQTASGREVFAGPTAPIRPDENGRLLRLMGLPLEGLSPGDYDLVLQFEDRSTGNRYERREPFRIATRRSTPRS
jgi:VWFA-related protein